MQTYPTFGIIFVTCAAFAAISQAGEISSPDKSQDDRIAIERLHQQDVEATLSDDADQLAKLWDENAIRLQAGALRKWVRRRSIPLTNGGRRIYMADAPSHTSQT